MVAHCPDDPSESRSSSGSPEVNPEEKEGEAGVSGDVIPHNCDSYKRKNSDSDRETSSYQEYCRERFQSKKKNRCLLELDDEFEDSSNIVVYQNAAVGERDSEDDESECGCSQGRKSVSPSSGVRRSSMLPMSKSDSFLVSHCREPTDDEDSDRATDSNSLLIRASEDRNILSGICQDCKANQNDCVCSSSHRGLAARKENGDKYLIFTTGLYLP